MDIRPINKPHFHGHNPLITTAVFLDERVLLNKAILDVAALDAPQIIMSNNKDERRERLNKSAISFALGYISPFITLPLSNRLVMSKVVKLSKNFTSSENKLIQLSFKYLDNKLNTQKGIELLSKELKTDFSGIINKFGGDYEKIRQKLINAKCIVLGSDMLFTAGSIGSLGFYNNWQTKKLTRQDGYSAEFKMADKDIVEKRAQKYKKSEPFRKGLFAGILTLLAASPLILKKGLNAKTASKFSNIISKLASKFDYTDGIFMKRLTFFMATIGIYSGITLASRNQTELKDNIIRSSVSMATFFGGDIVIGSILGKLSDKYLKTDIINKNADKNFLNKIIPPVRPLKELEGRSRKIGAGLFWANLALLSGIIGYGTPHLINKMIKHDVSKSAQNEPKQNKFSIIKSEAFKEFLEK